MKIDITQIGGTMEVALDGRLDTKSAPELEAFINQNCSNSETLILDCRNLVYVSSAGLRVLLTTQKKMKGAFKLINVCELVMEVFEMTGFTDVLTIE